MDSWLVASIFMWKAWAPALVVGIFGMRFTDFGSAPSNFFAALICVGLLGAIPLIHEMIKEITDARRPKAAVLDKPPVSLSEYWHLTESLSYILGAKVSILNGLTIEELQELASKELHKQGSAIVAKQRRNDSAYAEKQQFRENHATMYKLGLVQAHWDKYFPAE